MSVLSICQWTWIKFLKRLLGQFLFYFLFPSDVQSIPFFLGPFLYYALIKSPLHTYLQVVNFLITQKTRNTTFIFISFIDFKKQSLCIVQEQFGILVQIKDMSYEISDEFNMILEYIWKLSKKNMVTLQWLKTQIMNYFNTGTVDKTPWLIGSMSRWMCNIYSDLNTSQDVTYYKHLKIVYLYPKYMYLKSVCKFWSIKDEIISTWNHLFISS